MPLKGQKIFLSVRGDKVNEEVSHLRKVHYCVSLAIFVSVFGFSLRRPLKMNKI